MGYYSSFSLEIRAVKHGGDFHAIVKDLREFSSDANHALDELGDCSESSKWYTAQRDLSAFSKNYPEQLFVLEREGEEVLDAEKIYCKNGKSASLKIQTSWPEFKEEMLS